ncbi:MAG TPA: alanine racemase [Gemmatirosa sp.]
MAAQSIGPATPQAPTIEPATARAWLDVDLGAVVANARVVRARAGVPLVPMIKADGYGLGAVAVARALAAHGEPWGFGVASVAEAAELRAAGVAGRLLGFTPLLREEFGRADALGLTPSLHRAEDVHAWAAVAPHAPWHLAIDTGMARAGVPWNALDDGLLAAAAAHPPEGAYTHFHSADRADGSRATQTARFVAAVARLPARPRLLHAENGPAVESAAPSPWDLVRPGIFLYGVATARDPADGLRAPEPVAHLRARVVDVREVAAGETVSYGATWRADSARRIATVAAGYADGYRRALSNRGTVLLHGRLASVAGRVTMDMTMLDVTDIPCAVGDVATLVGAADGRVLTVADVAARADVSPYELLTGFALRAPRRYHGPA